MGTEIGMAFKACPDNLFILIMENDNIYIPSKYNKRAKFHPLGKKFTTD